MFSSCLSHEGFWRWSSLVAGTPSKRAGHKEEALHVRFHVWNCSFVVNVPTETNFAAFFLFFFFKMEDSGRRIDGNQWFHWCWPDPIGTPILWFQNSRNWEHQSHNVSLNNCIIDTSVFQSIWLLYVMKWSMWNVPMDELFYNSLVFLTSFGVSLWGIALGSWPTTLRRFCIAKHLILFSKNQGLHK